MDVSVDPVSSIETREWIKFRPLDPTSFEFKVNLIASEYTSAYSVDLVRVPVDGFSPPHTDPDNHAFYILAGHGAVMIDGRTWNVGPGMSSRSPSASSIRLPTAVMYRWNSSRSTIRLARAKRRTTRMHLVARFVLAVALVASLMIPRTGIAARHDRRSISD